MQQLPPWADPDVSETTLDPQGVSRRNLIRGAGLLGAAFTVSTVGATAAGATEAVAAPSSYRGSDPELVWLVGDHHVHSRYSHDAKYDFTQLAQRGAQFGLDWMAFTEHSNFGHADKGAAAENVEVVKARAENPRMLIFQGLEWYIPAAEHGTVLVAPGPNNVALLQQFEREYDGKLTNRSGDTPENEQHAIKGLQWLAAQKRSGFIDDVLVLANHPLRLGIDSPHEIRAWRDTGVCIGMEGAPGSQGDAEPAWVKFRGATNAQRGEYVNSPSAASFPGFPLDAYRTYGGFDWATATVGGLWDSLLAEGRLFSITSNSDNHRTIWDTWTDGVFPPGQNFDSLGWKPSPTNTDTPQAGSDFWPGQFSRTHVGVAKYGYLEVMAALRAGRVWVDHGQLVDGIDVRVAPVGSRQRGVTLGGRLRVRRHERLELRITVTSATRPNFHGVLPRLAHLDVIRGAVTGPTAQRDSWKAPDTRVVEQVDVHRRTGTYDLCIPLGRAERSHYVRVRGSDGNRHGVGYLGRNIDPAGPIQHPTNDGDPWLDTWLYTNPIFVDVV
ncbi:histidinol-phosphatase [Kribbella antibiotica]|uniref:Histidinol-phosphatase n=1 Tax=Kribbella antibiotica TaxID=190195 RepID=A0A4R4ZHL7_9ACTN|nr:PHP domain-containing protein [Kribbella antibiotica]TDD57536.1 histidinol-phosphatase [Kribbella antibiotica]